MSATWLVYYTYRCKICRLLWQAEKRFLDDLYRELAKFTAISKRRKCCYKGTFLIKTLAEICKRVSHILSYPQLKNRLPHVSANYYFCLQRSRGKLKSLDRKFSCFTQISLHVWERIEATQNSRFPGITFIFHFFSRIEKLVRGLYSFSEFPDTLRTTSCGLHKC